MPRGQHIAVTHQRGAAMMEDDALGIAGGAGGVVERDRVPFVVRHLPREIGIAAGEKLLVVDLAQRFARLREFADRHSR